MYYDAAIEILKQITFLGALLCGFSLTFLIGLFQLDSEDRSYRLSLITTAFATCTLLIGTIAGTAGIFWLSERPDLAVQDSIVDQREYLIAYRWSISFMLAGLLALLASIATIGWMKSKRLGISLALIALASLILIIRFLILMGVD